MTPQKLVQQIFEEALSVPDAERSILIRDRCHGDSSLEVEVVRLLEATRTSNGFFDAPTVAAFGSLGAKESPHSFSAGDLIANRFDILRFLNRGGMGEVYEAWDLELKERVALKTIRPEIAQSPDTLERFKREVKQARGVSHRNVCRVHELFCHEPNPYTRIWFLSMEFLEGVTLSDYIRHHGPMDKKAALELLEQMVHGLMAAHALGVIHRDFKTNNVMLVSSGPKRMRAVITDFGLALNVFGPRDGLQEPGGQGTPEFMAPEQRETGEVTFLADQYALGVVMCEVLTGARPVRIDGGPAVLRASGRTTSRNLGPAMEACHPPMSTNAPRGQIQNHGRRPHGSGASKDIAANPGMGGSRGIFIGGRHRNLVLLRIPSSSNISRRTPSAEPHRRRSP